MCSYLQFIAEFDLRSVQYEVKSSRCHEMRLAASPHDCIRFNFRCDREAEAWSTVVISSLREAHRGQFEQNSWFFFFFFIASTFLLKMLEDYYRAKLFIPVELYYNWILKCEISQVEIYKLEYH